MKQEAFVETKRGTALALNSAVSAAKLVRNLSNAGPDCANVSWSKLSHCGTLCKWGSVLFSGPLPLFIFPC